MVLYNWIIVLATIFFTGLIWTVFTPVLTSYVVPMLDTSLDNATINVTGARQTRDVTMFVWNSWPIIIIIGMIIYGITSSQKKEPDSGYW